MSLQKIMNDAIEKGDYASLVRIVPYAEWMSVKIENAEQGREYSMPFQERLLNNKIRMSLHGGAMAGFMENAALFEVIIEQQQRRIPKPIDFSIDFMRRGQAKACYAAVEIVREGRTVVLARVNCWQENRETPIAQARIHLLFEPVE